jgi:hypothetical protein
MPWRAYVHMDGTGCGGSKGSGVNLWSHTGRVGDLVWVSDTARLGYGLACGCGRSVIHVYVLCSQQLLERRDKHSQLRP